MLNLLNEADDSKFVTREWSTVKDQWFQKYGEKNEIICNT